MSSTEAPIGASVIDYIQRNNIDGEPTSATESGLEETSTPTIPSLIPTPTSSNMIIYGPGQSGRSSLVMNMAQSLAHASRALCRGDCGSVSCCCPNVILLAPLSEEKQQRFPLSCHVVESLPLDFYDQLRALQHPQESKTRTGVWNKAALRRIQVHYMASIRNVMDYLLSIQGKTPLSAIIVEDLDVFVRGGDSCHSGDFSTQHLMLMTQTLALLADTANTVRRTQTASFSVLATMKGERVPWNVQRLWSTWFPISLKIFTSTVWKTPQLEEDERVESSFVVQQQQMEDGKERPGASVAHYVIVRQNNGSLRIVWKRGEEE